MCMRMPVYLLVPLQFDSPMLLDPGGTVMPGSVLAGGRRSLSATSAAGSESKRMLCLCMHGMQEHCGPVKLHKADTEKFQAHGL